MPTPVIRMAGAADAAALAALRRTWTEENAGDVADEGFEARFIEWYERESARRLTWLAEIESRPVGMMNLSVFERMPRPGTEVGRWGYVGNAFVLAEHRDQGIGSLLLAALLAYADSHGFVRVVLRPTQRAIPFYQRAGFGTNGGLLVRPGRLAGRADAARGGRWWHSWAMSSRGMRLATLVGGAVWAGSWYLMYLEITRWRHVRPSLAFNSDPVPGTDIRPRPGLPLILVYIACVAAPLVVLAALAGLVRSRETSVRR